MDNRKAGSIVAVIPALNEEATVARIVMETRSCWRHVLVVDDGSQDRTAALAEAAGAHVIRLERNLGLGAALKTGFSYALSKGYELVVTLDADGVHDPRDGPQLVASHYETAADVTIGSRFNRRLLSSVLPTAKVAANLFATVLLNSVTGLKLTDASSGFRVLGRKALEKTLESSTYAIAWELIVATRTHGLRLSQRRINARYDARELFMTGRQELLELLSFLARQAEHGSKLTLMNGIARLAGLVESNAIARVALPNHLLVLHPLALYDAFVFQFHPDWYHRYAHQEDEEWIEIP